ncbi:hypothetical protein PIB30_066546 [Stylosanthes scabra]|uniref:Uncharacterized protein n=1 Tax=Stylosanthes scabra TaxID=79078 RepID=A0ABU6ULT3_9FABA|nr:hypothetical protein [Stylosanthes scabra]
MGDTALCTVFELKRCDKCDSSTKRSRVLRSEALQTQVVVENNGGEGFNKGEASSNSGMASSSSKLSIISTRPSTRSLAFKLASGPSRKGRGH